jgi:hypothetical protein
MGKQRAVDSNLYSKDLRGWSDLHQQCLAPFFAMSIAHERLLAGGDGLPLALGEGLPPQRKRFDVCSTWVYVR